MCSQAGSLNLADARLTLQTILGKISERNQTPSHLYWPSLVAAVALLSATDTPRLEARARAGFSHRSDKPLLVFLPPFRFYQRCFSAQRFQSLNQKENGWYIQKRTCVTISRQMNLQVTSGQFLSAVGDINKPLLSGLRFNAYMRTRMHAHDHTCRSKGIPIASLR